MGPVIYVRFAVVVVASGPSVVKPMVVTPVITLVTVATEVAIKRVEDILIFPPLELVVEWKARI